MSELMISPAPAPLPSGTKSANAPGQSEASSQSGASAKTETESGTKSPFATELKSRMDAVADDVAGRQASQVAESQTDAENPAISLDRSALLPLLGINPVGTASVMTTPVADTEPATLPELLPMAAQVTAQILAPPQSPPAVALDKGHRQQGLRAKDEEFIPAPPVTAGGTDRVSGKIALDAAINADLAPKRTGNNASELPANEFHALIERATAMMSGAANPTNPGSASASLRVDTPLGQPGWHDEVGQKLTWMVGNNRQQADLVLTPPHLGRVEVSLTMNGDQATAIFTSANPAVREALEGSLHRLREVLADAGVSLGQTQVGSESPNQSRGNEQHLGMNEGVRYASTISLPGVAAVARSEAKRSMIDIFA